MLNELQLEKIAFHLQCLNISFLMSESHRRGLITDINYDEWLIGQRDIIKKFIDNSENGEMK